jgi:phosphoribosylformimino-5-aminoimidazole carboxamide ribotide isomerase
MIVKDHESLTNLQLLNNIMLIIPAIDLKEGQCVRLKPGPIENETIFSENPTKMAENWLRAGARRLHLVDLNGAGKSKNVFALRQILQVVGNDIPVQLGGGIRSLDTIEQYLDAGLHYAIIGAAAIKTPGFLHEACDAFPGQVIVSLDAKAGKVITDGWTKTTHHDVIDLAKRFEDYGVEAIIYTDIGCDGMLSGVNIEATVKLAQALHIPVIAGGGINHLNDVRNLCAVEEEGIMGVITGQAIYEGTVDLSTAQTLADELNNRA